MHKFLTIFQLQEMAKVHPHQCDQMARLFFYIWTFTTLNISQMTLFFAKEGFNFAKY